MVKNVGRLFFGLVLSVSNFPAMAQSALSVPASVATIVNKWVYVPVTLKLDGVTDLAAFQVQVTITTTKPTTMQVGKPIIESAADVPDKTLSCGGANGLWCFISGVSPSGVNANEFKAGGTVFIVPILVGQNFPGGTLTLSGGYASAEPAAPIALSTSGACNLLAPS